MQTTKDQGGGGRPGRQGAMERQEDLGQSPYEDHNPIRLGPRSEKKSRNQSWNHKATLVNME